ncbi:MAG: 3-phosphoshikimate 1-carboxyvinyltransferase [Candidatus Dormibacteraeota bacterium]|nr:3-phosphoshikimate 1-carboxyvinyltransferase [Candidatus Dormibacteraeota bacterium]MBV9526125.1 3-phosphoshikimate 1-carboxyvinyltransferase [Candidatus Dormibacteraeota bacterium]
MTSRSVAPASRLDATLTVPGDKAISHRALIVGSIARGRSYVGNVSPAADVTATAECLRACGVWLRDFADGRVALDGAGPGMSLRTPAVTLDCANSGTTMRLLAGALAGHDCTAELTGDASLRKRPMRRVAAPLTAMGATVRVSPDGTAPLHVEGRSSLRAVDWTPETPSAQVKSLVLLAALSADGVSTVRERIATRDHTERLLRRCGVSVRTDGDVVSITPGAVAPFGMRVPGDISSAAFFLCLGAALPGSRVRMQRVGLNPGRTGVLDALRDMGATVVVEPAAADESAEPEGDVEVRGGALQGTVIAGDLVTRCIDELPVLAVLATQAEGETLIRDAAELRAKESDRISAVVEGLRAFGGVCEAADDGLVVQGPSRLRAARVDARGDHRLAMAFAVAASIAAADSGESVIESADSAAVSYPAFFDDLARAVRSR